MPHIAPTKRTLALSEQRTEQTIKVLQITDVHADRSSQDEMKDGKSSYRPILNNGTE